MFDNAPLANARRRKRPPQASRITLDEAETAPPASTTVSRSVTRPPGWVGLAGMVFVGGESLDHTDAGKPVLEHVRLLVHAWETEPVAARRRSCAPAIRGG